MVHLVVYMRIGRKVRVRLRNQVGKREKERGSWRRDIFMILSNSKPSIHAHRQDFKLQLRLRYIHHNRGRLWENVIDIIVITIMLRFFRLPKSIRYDPNYDHEPLFKILLIVVKVIDLWGNAINGWDVRFITCNLMR